MQDKPTLSGETMHPRFSAQVLTISALSLALLGGSPLSADTPNTLPPMVEARILDAPTPAHAEGKTYLVYELHITNFDRRPLKLKRLEVYSRAAEPIAQYKEDELVPRLRLLGAPPDATAKDRTIPPGVRSIYFGWLAFGAGATVPRSLHHRLVFTADDPQKELILKTDPTSIRPDTRLVVDSPLRGEGWLAGNGPSNTSDHRRTILPIDGPARIAQRFAIDWVRFGTSGNIYRGDGKKNADHYAYGSEIHAVADGTVCATKDGIPQNEPNKPPVLTSVDMIPGNHILQDLGNGHYAMYAHLQPGSLRVKPGEKVRRGQVLGLLGNSGNSTAPHLHFQVMDACSPLGSEGLPYGLPAYEKQGMGNIDDQGAASWKALPTANQSQNRHLKEIPLENEVVRFLPTQK